MSAEDSCRHCRFEIKANFLSQYVGKRPPPLSHVDQLLDFDSLIVKASHTNLLRIRQSSALSNVIFLKLESTSKSRNFFFKMPDCPLLPLHQGGVIMFNLRIRGDRPLGCKR